MITLLLILTPLVAGLIAFSLKQGSSAKTFALLASLATLAIALVAVFTPGTIGYDAAWLNSLGSRISFKADGMGKMLSLLTAVSFPIIFTAVYSFSYQSSNSCLSSTDNCPISAAPRWAYTRSRSRTKDQLNARVCGWCVKINTESGCILVT